MDDAVHILEGERVVPKFACLRIRVVGAVPCSRVFGTRVGAWCVCVGGRLGARAGVFVGCARCMKQRADPGAR